MLRTLGICIAILLSFGCAATAKKTRKKTQRPKTSCEITNQNLTHQVGRFEMHLYEDRISRQATPLIDCYLLLKNDTSKPFKITFFYKNHAGEYVALPDSRKTALKINKKIVTGFALPIYKICKNLAPAGTQQNARTAIEAAVPVLINGFAITTLTDDPKKPTVELPSKRDHAPTFFYQIIINDQGVSVAPLTQLGTLSV